MSDFPLLTDELPKIVYVCRTEYNTRALTTKDFGAEYIRADLAPVIGYSAQQMREAMVQCVVSDDKIDEILEALTPTAQPRDPAVLVEALEYYAKQRRYGEDGGLAREALAEWNARQPEANMLDLGGLERFGLVEDSTWYNCLQAKEDGDYVRYSDLTNALLTKGRGGAV